jgi:hypothetical protein
MKRGTLLLLLIALCVFANAACGPNNHPVTPPVVPSQNFSFYATGEENNADAGDTYTIAGVASIATTASADGSFAVVGGEQDYNDGDEITSPQPSGDVISGGALVVASDGTGTLTLTTTNPNVGNNGTEIFAVAFPNPNHALITQFDGSATSLGSLDLQTSTATPSGAFSFAATGVDPTGTLVGDGGVFTVTGGALSGIVDVVDGGPPTLNTPFTGTVSTPDSFGRGTITNTGIAIILNYYVVGPECIRVIDMDTTDIDLGSAYGQGANPSFSNVSIGQSAFSMANSTQLYSAAGQFTTDAGTAAKPKSNSVGRDVSEGGPVLNNFTGVGDLNELDEVLLPAQPISGTYTLAGNGYGSMSFAEGVFGDVEAFGVYAVDPTLNILDPNNPVGGGGALLVEMDGNLIGTGALLPQTDITVASFDGSYAFAAQGDTDADGDEFDFLGTASMSSDTGAFSGSGFLSDPLAALVDGSLLSSTVSFAATAVPDPSNPGRYNFNPLALTTPDVNGEIDLNFGIYQANGGQLFWVDLDGDSGIEAGGSLQQFPGSGADAKRAIKKH